MSHSARTRLGPYEVLDLIGAGGMTGRPRDAERTAFRPGLEQRFQVGQPV
jgi:hypothetical protein